MSKDQGSTRRNMFIQIYRFQGSTRRNMFIQIYQLPATRCPRPRGPATRRAAARSASLALQTVLGVGVGRGTGVNSGFIDMGVLLLSWKCTMKVIWRQGIVLKHGSSLQKSLCPVVICPYLCSSEVWMSRLGTISSGSTVWCEVLRISTRCCLISIIISTSMIIISSSSSSSRIMIMTMTMTMTMRMSMNMMMMMMMISSSSSSSSSTAWRGRSARRGCRARATPPRSMAWHKGYIICNTLTILTLCITCVQV